MFHKCAVLITIYWADGLSKHIILTKALSQFSSSKTWDSIFEPQPCGTSCGRWNSAISYALLPESEITHSVSFAGLQTLLTNQYAWTIHALVSSRCQIYKLLVANLVQNSWLTSADQILHHELRVAQSQQPHYNQLQQFLLPPCHDGHHL